MSVDVPISRDNLIEEMEAFTASISITPTDPQVEFTADMAVITIVDADRKCSY